MPAQSSSHLSLIDKPWGLELVLIWRKNILPKSKVIEITQMYTHYRKAGTKVVLFQSNHPSKFSLNFSLGWHLMILQKAT